MGKIKWLGLISIGVGLLFLGFQAIDYMISEGARFHNHTLVSLFGKDAFDWIERFPFAVLRSSLDSVTEAPFFIVLLVIGAVLLLIHGIFAKG